MNKKLNHKSQPLNLQLRAKAEAKLTSVQQPLENRSTQATDKLLYELQVHQIELDMQNEELRRTQLALEESRDRYINLYEFAPVGYLTLTSEGLIAEANLTATRLLGVEREKLINRYFTRYVIPNECDRWYRHFLQFKQQIGKQQQCELNLRRDNGSSFYACLDCLSIETNDASFMLRITITDITKLKLAEQQLRIAATVFESQEGIMVTDAKGLIIGVNNAFTEVTGYSSDEVIGKISRLFQSDRHAEKFYTTMWDSINRTGSWKGEIWNRRKEGEVYPEHINITAVKDQDGIVSNYVATFDDITQNKLAADEIERLAFYDPLTSLPNRRLLLDRLKQALASSVHSGKKGALLFIDLDNFKTLNDTLGHDMGDLLLRQVAERLNICVREDDTVARLGGDEFVVMLENLDTRLFEAATQTKAVGEKILATLNQPYQLETHDYHSTSSIGATLFKGHQQPVDELLKQADIAMYQSKTAGRNTLRFFDPQMQADINARAKLEADLRHALIDNQFELYFQSQVNHNKSPIGAEVLIRWHHPQHGLICPNDFIFLAEETGLIVPIGLWVLETACAQIKRWENSVQTWHLQLSVNVSARQFRHPDFVEQVRQVLRRSNIKPNKLKLELTESLIIDNVESTIKKMNSLRECGVHFSMDDFGTGYSSLAYLTQLPIDQLKIDRSFVHNIGIKPSDGMIVQTIIGMANNLGMEVIAEGVETEAQRAFLEQYGCSICQGYLFSQPLPIEQFELLLKQH